jgi:hypothetical protein
MRFLVVDDRSGPTVHVFLRSDPTGEDGYPGLRVFPVTLERPPHPAGDGAVVARHFYFPDLFREFGSGRAAAEALFRPVGPSYVGLTWGDYVTETRHRVR